MTTIIIIIISSVALNIFIINNPLSIGISILVIALFVALLFSFSISSWLAFLIFLIYIGGILVIFSYFVSLTPNQSINIISIILLTLSTLIILLSLSKLLNIYNLIPNIYYTQTNIFYLKSNTPLLFLLAIILLITIIIVVKLTINIKGPIRPFLNKYV